ncbi:MAG: hypothetical protein PQJ58_10340 [Spirochaetales bacterium]|nr:hypothetical protein [Spirochaetales bacterium]
MILYYDKRIQCISFGMEKVKQALGTGFIEKNLKTFDHSPDLTALVVRFSHGHWEIVPQCDCNPELKAEGFEIIRKGKVIYLNAYDRVGAMYGLLDIAETISNEGLDAVKDKIANPFHEKRGIKHNLPYEPYDEGSPFSENRETMMDIGYWKAYIEMLAANRYNTLSLWSENPFPMMFRLDKYPGTCPYTEQELARYKECYHFIFEYAWQLGISTYLITWNVRLTPAIASGLGLPAELGDMNDRYDVIRDNREGIPNESADLDVSRCHLPVIQDYMKECIKTLCLSYKYLTGIGTTSSEEMSGPTEERVHWVKQAYLEGIRESGRQMPFIFRTNLTSSESIVDDFMKDYSFGEKYLSWKYSNAHMYSSPEPMFEKEWKAWDDVSLDGLNLIYTVRNDDFHTFRGGSYPFIKAYIKGMKRHPKAKGFYWGADGYVWGRDFQHVPHKHMTWTYDWEKHWNQFMLLGRLGYDPETAQDIFIREFERQYSKAVGASFFNGCNAAMEILENLQRTSWINYDFESHPESLITVTGFRSVLDYLDRKAMAGIGTLSLDETAQNIVNGVQEDREDALDCIEGIVKATAAVENEIKAIETNCSQDMMGGAIECALLDLKCWAYLGQYYVKKLSAALDLCCLRCSGDERYRASAVKHLEEAVQPFEDLAAAWSSHYMPYKMVRSKYMFGYSYYIDDVKKDIRLAANAELFKK